MTEGATKALTIWQPWASLIMLGAKPYEWRRWKAPASMVGKRIVIHAGARRTTTEEIWGLIQSVIHEVNAIEEQRPVEHPTALDVYKALPFLLNIYDGGIRLPLSAGLGTVVIGEPRLAGDLGFPIDSDRPQDQNWGWPMLDVQPFADPIPMRGAQGFWKWCDASNAVENLLL
ncbi:ASCH domain-containing protein [Sphingomonas oligoaromativorans]|uniref:ASCH domain-containing protein n=1 Tax=Sphingomonas oligoaromativorans TaxID=575322 RepID=UPI00142094BD|nr:ASCH domain-containing protein [Sphingomonas oligoaromativorans]NIJ34307.1 hypothetical protein [Sphingomonas oligoaromativorans]